MIDFEWFKSNFMKLNQDKCHFLLSGRKHEVMFAKVGHSKIWESCAQKLLEIIIDRNLKFDEYVLIQCKKAGRKRKALETIIIGEIIFNLEYSIIRQFTYNF